MNWKNLVINLFTTRLQRFQNIHKGDTCYIFGDGPSIKWFDLKQFNNHPAICCGQIPFHKDFKKIDVRYAMMVEPWLFMPKLMQPNLPKFHQFTEMTEEYRSFIINNEEIEFFVSLSNRYGLLGKNVNYVYKGFPKTSSEIDFRLKNYDLFAGSFHSVLSLAYYMGFSKIYLVGFDAWTVQPSRTMRWYELGEGRFYKTTNFAQDFLEILKSHIDIYTISLSGDSCNVKNISYKDFTGKIPEYKENHELMTPEHLSKLAKCTSYNIFHKKTELSCGM